MCPRDLSRTRGRPRRSLIEDPFGKRREGERAWGRKMAEYDRKVRTFGTKACTKPKQPMDEFDRGLIYAAYAGLIAHQSVRPIAERTRAFLRWMQTQRSARGSCPDAELAARVYQALDTVDAIRRREVAEPHEKPERIEPATREVREALELLFGEAPALNTVKRRLQDLRPRKAKFEAERRRLGS